jgi:hypothetical protein
VKKGVWIELPCRKWTCESCGPQKVKRLRIRFGLGDLQPGWFLTLTLHTSDQKPIMDAWNLFLAGLRKDGYQIRYLLAKEFTRAGKRHLHVIGEGWVPFRELSKRWKRATSCSKWTHVRPLRDKARAAGYVTKYMMKAVGSRLYEHKERRYSSSRGVLFTFPKREKSTWTTYIHRAKHKPGDYRRWLARSNRDRSAYLETLLPCASALLPEQEHLSSWTLIHSL